MSSLAIRIRLRLKAGREVEVRALVNSGFETNTPDIAIPLSLAREIGIWPPQRGSVVEMETAAGSAEGLIISNAVTVQPVDRPDKVVTANALVIDGLSEVLISDYLASELGLVLLDLKKGLWRFNDDPPNLIRQSA